MKSLSNRASPVWEPLLGKLADKLNVIKGQNEKTQEMAKYSMLVCRELMHELQNLIINYVFQDQAEEIYFFKEVKTQFYSRLLYYHKLYNLELGRPIIGTNDHRSYYQKEIDRIRNFFDENIFLYKYFRSGETYMDEVLFLRNRKNVLPSRIYDIHSHPGFSTNYDYLFSRIQANELLLNYLNKKLLSLNAATESGDTATPIPKLPWTDSKVALIELIYAFKAKGSFKNGKASLREISDFIQKVFDIHLTNTSRDFQEILRRKTGYTVYLDELRDSYLRYIDEIENKER